MGSLFGGGDKTQKTSTTSSTQFPQWTQDAGKATTGAAYAMGSPFLQVPTNAVAGYTADQIKAFDLARQSAQGAYQGGAIPTPTGSYQAAQIGPARSATAQTLNANDIASYMNPYMSSVLEPAVAQARAEARSTQSDIGARAAAAGAFGGSREAVGRALAARSANENITSTTANMMKAGYDAAQGYAQNQATARQQTELANTTAANQFALQQAEYQQQAAMGNPTLAISQAQTADALRSNDLDRQMRALQQLLGNGNQQQLFGQKAIDVPWDTLARIAQYVPNVYNQSGSGTETAPNNSPGLFQQLIGAAGSVAMAPVTGGGSLIGNYLTK